MARHALFALMVGSLALASASVEAAGSPESAPVLPTATLNVALNSFSSSPLPGRLGIRPTKTMRTLTWLGHAAEYFVAERLASERPERPTSKNPHLSHDDRRPTR